MANRFTPPARRRATLGSHRSHRGRYQLRSPSSASAAGHADPPHDGGIDEYRERQPDADHLQVDVDSEAKIEKTATMITAALVTTPAPVEIPPTTACLVDSPRPRSSAIRLRMNTW